MRLLRCAALAAALLGLAPTQTLAQARPELAALPEPAHAAALAAARDRIERLMAQHHIPGASVGAMVDGEIVWLEGLGFADLEARAAATPLTRFRIGSVSKSLTGYALARLVDQGALGFDDPATKHLPDLPEAWRGVTLAQLAGHTAGVRHYRDDGSDFLITTHYPGVADSLALFINDPLLSPPGTRYFYSSYGFNLLSAAMEKAAGRPFLELMQEEVFDPLNMTSATADHTLRIIPHRTRFYEASAEHGALNAPFVDNSSKWAGGGFLATPRDLLAFGQEMIARERIGAASADRIVTSQKLASGEATGYGLGFFDGLALFRSEYDGADAAVLDAASASGRRIWEHRGGSVGGSTSLVISPDAKVVVAMMWNMRGFGDALMIEALRLEQALAAAVAAEPAR